MLSGKCHPCLNADGKGRGGAELLEMSGRGCENRTMAVRCANSGVFAVTTFDQLLGVVRSTRGIGVG
jgi:hypothetical protein